MLAVMLLTIDLISNILFKYKKGHFIAPNISNKNLINK
jgi:hypothetical protein